MTAAYGYAGKMLFVDLNTGTIHDEALTDDLARAYVGGYGLGVRTMIERIPQGADPLGPENMFGIGTGPFTHSGVLSSCRFTTMGKSPLTGYWGDANSGGTLGNALKASGYDAVFFQGRSEHPVYLLIVEGRAKLKDARHLWGVDTNRTEDTIQSENNNHLLKIASIGPGGEKLSRMAAVINDKGRAAARSGLGAVMGSKNLKAVACHGTLRPPVYDKTALKQLMKKVVTTMKTHPTFMFQELSKTGTPGAMTHHMAEHDVPIKNWSGNFVDDFPEEKWERVAWPGMEAYVDKKYACTGCPIGCGSIVSLPDGTKYKVKGGHKPEYETLAAFGPMCLNDDMASLIYANELCNLYGLDTITTGTTIAFAMECYEYGILTGSDTDGIELRWGNSEAIIQMLEKICKREGIGDILAEGPQRAARTIGRGAEQFAMHVGGEAPAMHDPRCYPGWGATYVSDATPGRHVRGGTAFVENGMPVKPILQELGLPPQVEKYNPQGKGEMHAVMNAWQHWVNTSGACLFAVDAIDLPMLDLVRSITGWELSNDEFLQTGRRIATLLHGFNLREGFQPEDFKLPERVAGRPPLPKGPLTDISVDSEDLKSQFYKAMGFDAKTSAIKAETIKALGLEGLL